MNKEEYKQYIKERPVDIFNDVKQFLDKFELMSNFSKTKFFDHEFMETRINHISEEYEEILKAYSNNDIAEVCDGLIDLIYVASGILLMMNAPCESLWNDVHLCNMKKIKASKENRSKRDYHIDVVKPVGWVPPITKEILEDYI